VNKIATAIKQAAARGEQLYLKLCRVDSVNTTERTISCTPVDGGAQLIGVNLQATTSQTAGVTLFPKPGTSVAVGYYDRNNAVVILMDAVDKIAVNCDSIQFNDGTNRGLVKIGLLEQNMNSIKDYLQVLSIAIATGLAGTVGNGGAAAATAFTSQMQGVSINYADMENKKITH
jgi:hypothetical protein